MKFTIVSKVLGNNQSCNLICLYTPLLGNKPKKFDFFTRPFLLGGAHGLGMRLDHELGARE